MVGLILNGRCNIYGYREQTDGAVTKSNKYMIAECVPCHLSYSSSQKAYQTKQSANSSQEIKLFLERGCPIKAGCSVEVCQNGENVEYEAAGQIKYYSSHIEVELIAKAMHT